MNEQERTRSCTGKVRQGDSTEDFREGAEAPKIITGKGAYAKMAAKKLRESYVFPEPVSGACWIPLSRGMFAIVDKKDYAAASRFTWYASPSTKTVYAKGIMRVGGRWATIYLHRFVMGVCDERQVDHRDGNGLDCRRHNLRICDSQGNNMNRRKSENQTSRFKGVSWDRSRTKWRATIKINRKLRYLGRFDSEPTAAEAYDRAARTLFGEYAILNFPTA